MTNVDTSAEAVAETCRHLRLLAVGLAAQFPQHARLNMFDPQIAQIEALAAQRDALKEHNDLQAAMLRGEAEVNKDMTASIARLEADRDRLAAEVERLHGALTDLMTWFPARPSPPEWRLPGGKYGADEAIAAARAALGDNRHD